MDRKSELRRKLRNKIKQSQNLRNGIVEQNKVFSDDIMDSLCKSKKEEKLQKSSDLLMLFIIIRYNNMQKVLKQVWIK